MADVDGDGSNANVTIHRNHFVNVLVITDEGYVNGMLLAGLLKYYVCTNDL